MEEKMDIRWKQRYDNYHKACQKLLEVTDSDRFREDLSELEQEGLVQRFEYTYELSWKVLQDLLTSKGYQFMLGPNGTLKMAFEDGIISNHDGWRRMGKARNTASHIYNKEEAMQIVNQIYDEFADLLKDLDDKLQEQSQNDEV